jgi:hypothetical protein
MRLKEVVISTPPCRIAPISSNRKHARELLQTALSGDLAALARMGDHHPRLRGRTPQELTGAPLALHDSQLVLAREYGFSTWADLKHEIERR